MRKIIYYVASSLDGFIAGPNDDISGFVGTGNGVEQYLNDLKGFDTVIMGRKTYEFGYQYGLQPGQLAYQQMTHFILSNHFTLENCDPKIHIKKVTLAEIDEIRGQLGTDIYLCGGGQLAGWLLENERIDILKLKLNPFILNDGIKIFGDSKKSVQLEIIEQEKYDHDLQIITYKIKYN